MPLVDMQHIEDVAFATLGTLIALAGDAEQGAAWPEPDETSHEDIAFEADETEMLPAGRL